MSGPAQYRVSSLYCEGNIRRRDGRRYGWASELCASAGRVVQCGRVDSGFLGNPPRQGLPGGYMGLLFVPPASCEHHQTRGRPIWQGSRWRSWWRRTNSAISWSGIWEPRTQRPQPEHQSALGHLDRSSAARLAPGAFALAHTPAPVLARSPEGPLPPWCASHCRIVWRTSDKLRCRVGARNSSEAHCWATAGGCELRHPCR